VVHLLMVVLAALMVAVVLARPRQQLLEVLVQQA
jgi:hypothetical protein